MDFFFFLKEDSAICCLQETHFRSKNTHTKSKEMEKDIPHKWKQKAGAAIIAILTSDKIDSKTESIIKDKIKGIT